MLVVLTSGRGRLNGSFFAAGFLAGQSVLCLLAIFIGTLSVPGHGEHPAIEAAFAILFGAALLATAVWVRRDRGRPPRLTPSPRTAAVRKRLSSLSPLTALVAGTILGVGGPKRIGVTLVATGAITTAGLSDAHEAELTVLYVLVATVLVWIPVALYVVFGGRAADWLRDAQAWISVHKDPLTFYPSAVLGVVLVGIGAVQLFG